MYGQVNTIVDGNVYRRRANPSHLRKDYGNGFWHLHSDAGIDFAQRLLNLFDLLGYRGILSLFLSEARCMFVKVLPYNTQALQTTL